MQKEQEYGEGDIIFVYRYLFGNMWSNISFTMKNQSKCGTNNG